MHEVKARLVINATGVWADELRLRFGLEGRRLRPSRGTHLVFARERLPLDDAIAVMSPDDRRPVFFLPHPEGTLLGTTDIFHDGGLEDPAADPRRGRLPAARPPPAPSRRRRSPKRTSSAPSPASAR